MVKCVHDTPAYDLALVASLAKSAKTFHIQPNVQLDIASLALDDDDVREWLQNAVKHKADGNLWFKKCRPTEKYPPDTCSDYYGGIVSGMNRRAYIKFAMRNGHVILTSFKEDEDEWGR